MDLVKLFCSKWLSKESDAEKITWIIDCLEQTWNKAGIPTRHTASIRSKVKSNLMKFKSILNTRRQSTPLQVEKENAFIEKNRVLFDIVDQKSESKLSHMKKIFLSDQRNNRNQIFSDLNSTENSSEELIDNQLSDDSMMSVDSPATESTEENDSEYCPSSSDEEETIPKKKLKQATIQKMDEAGLSFRQMQHVAHAFIEEFDENPDHYCLGISTFHSNSTKIRKVTVEKMSEEMTNRKSKLVLLFDTKTFNQINAAHLPREKRLAIVAYNERTHYGLSLSPIENGLANTLRDELWNCTVRYDLNNRIIGLVCDTENTNTGFRGGTCTKFELKIEKEILLLCCRHHILEIILKKVCYCLLGSNETPHFNFEGADQLKSRWRQLNTADFLPLENEEFEDLPILTALKIQAIDQLKRDAQQQHIRDDYAEINDICLKLLGIQTNKKIRIIGASGKARWMAKALLVAKTFLFRHQLQLEPHICDALRRICIFISLIYVKFWNRATSATDAPVNDLILMQQLHVYRSYDNEVAQTAINSFAEHLWYLGSELITLALFSDQVTSATKNKMRLRFRSDLSGRNEQSLRFIMDETTPQFGDLNLEDFIQPRSFYLFQLLEVTPDFLNQDALAWEYTASYIAIKNIVCSNITVINDGAERILGMADKSIKNQKARKEKNFKDLIFSKFDRNSRN